jgi:hypothetical protein
VTTGQDVGLKAFDAVLQDAGGDYDAATQQFVGELVRSGAAPEEANRLAVSRMMDHRMRNAPPEDPADAVASGVDLGINAPRESGLAGDDGYRDWSGWSPGMPLPAARDWRAGRDADRAAADARLTALQRPMIDADNRDAMARERWRQDNPEQADQDAVAARERADDYRKERLLYRMAEKTGIPIEQLREENPQFASVGQIPSRDGGGMPTLTRTRDGTQMRDMPTSTSRMRDAAAQRRIADSQKREKSWKAQAMLAGRDPGKNAVNAFNIMTPEQQQDVVQTRMQFPNREGGKGDEWDRRLDMMRLQMENDRTEREKDRTMTREERQAAREDAERRFTEERAIRDKEWEDRSRKWEQEQLLATQRHDAQMAAQSGQLEALRQSGVRGDAELDIRREEAAAKADAQKQTQALQDRAMEMKFMAERPGEYAVATGLQTPEADDFLKRLASQSDRFQWLPGGGFGEREAGSLNASLLDLARQAELAGLNTRLRDRAYREELIKKYGYASGWSGGRGGWMGDFWQPIPPDPTVAAQ